MEKNEIATVANGCFWCTEAIFQRLKGVKEVISGYTGGIKVDPTYEEVCSGKTGHAEAIQIMFDPTIISFENIIEIFFYTHDPTTMNKQGNDVGTQYRSSIFYHNNAQKEISHKVKRNLEETYEFKDQIVTQIVPFSVFYPAENYHTNYFNRNQNNSYCNFIIQPKVKKLLAKYQACIQEQYAS